MTNTKEEILQRMLEQVTDRLDKREGSVIYDTRAPAAYELSLAYEEMQRLYANTYARTADRQGLIECAAELGLQPYPATYAVRKGVFVPTGIDIPIGARFNYEKLNFAVTEKISDGEYMLTCETIGTVGNEGSGLLIPIEYIQGLETAELVDILVYGEEEKDTEAFRERYFESINSEERDGNIAQYKAWVSAFPGIGNAKIMPLWNGANTVKVSILDTENGIASDTLVEAFQEYLDPGSAGLGNGVAPIGAIVTVSTATQVPIDLTGTVILAEGYSNIEGVEEAVRKHLSSISYAKTTVSYMSLGAAIQDCPCIEDLSNFLLNGSTANLALGSEEIPVLQNLSLAVV